VEPRTISLASNEFEIPAVQGSVSAVIYAREDFELEVTPVELPKTN